MSEPNEPVVETAAQAARRIAHEFQAALRHDAAAHRKARRAGLRLSIEWFAIVSITYILVYAQHPVGLKIALLIPWSIYASLALDSITHHANHWPLFASARKNWLWRASGVLVFFNPIEIRAIHNAHHHAYRRRDNEERVFGPARRGQSFLRYLLVELLDRLRVLLPWETMVPVVSALAKRRPEQYRELRLQRWAFLGWLALLLILDWRDTLFYFVPSVLIAGSFCSLVLDLSDHIPGDSHHRFRLATYLEPSTRREEIYSALNHQTCATHLTHHLFPRVHWVHLRALQRRLAPIYRESGSPQSLIVNSTLAGNPLRLAVVLRRLAQRRFDV